jgi:hypothetical protein
MDNVIFAIQSALEEFSWLFIHIQRNNGTLSLPREFIDFFCKVKQPDWASYYESQQKLDTIAVMIFFEPEDIREMADEIRQLPPADVHAYRKEIEDYVCAEFGELKSSPFDFHFLSPKEVEVYLQTTSLDQQQKDLVKAYLMFTTFITQTFQFLALATHGRTMHELVFPT